VRELVGYALVPDAVRDAAIAVLAALAVGLVKVVWAMGSRLSRLEGECEADRRRAGAPSEPRE